MKNAMQDGRNKSVLGEGRRGRASIYDLRPVVVPANHTKYYSTCAEERPLDSLCLPPTLTFFLA